MDGRGEDFAFLDRDKLSIHCLLQRPALLMKKIKDEVLIYNVILVSDKINIEIDLSVIQKAAVEETAASQTV